MRSPVQCSWFAALAAMGLIPLLSGCPTPAQSDASDITADVFDGGPDVVDVIEDDASAPDVTPAWLVPWSPTPRSHFPAAFLWGSATAAYQIEGQLHATDWYQWEQMGHIVNNDHADDGPQSLTQYMQDIQTLANTSQNSYRMGIEWARVFPTAAAWATCRDATGDAVTRFQTCRNAADATGRDYYHTVLTALISRGITPMVTLQHFVLPTHQNDLAQDWHTQGWMRDGIVDDLAKWAEFAASEYGGEVDWWITLNEPTAYAVIAYLDGRDPPGQQLQTDAVVHVAMNMIHAHVRMYDAIHTADTRQMVCSTTPCAATGAGPAMVSIAHHARRFFGYDPTSSRDTASAARIDRIYNRTFFDAIVLGNLDTNLNGMIDAGEPMNDATLSHRADFLGINYYTTQIIQTNLAIPLLRALPRPDSDPRGLPKNDLGWDLYPRGLYDTLMWAQTYGLPILITENGIADHTDTNRPRFLAEHLAAVAAAIHDGADVRGYYHWSNIDNFEWISGYCPSFGLYSVDRTSTARPRVQRPSALIYRQIIQAGEVTDALLSTQPPYQTPTSFCADRATPSDGGL